MAIVPELCLGLDRQLQPLGARSSSVELSPELLWLRCFPLLAAAQWASPARRDLVPFVFRVTPALQCPRPERNAPDYLRIFSGTAVMRRENRPFLDRNELDSD